MPARSSNPNASNDDYRQFFDITLEMLCVLDEGLRVQQANPAWTAALGWTKEELIGREIGDFVHPADHRDFVDEIASIASGGENVSLLVRFRNSAGSYRDLRWSAASSEESEFTVAAARDVTEYRALVQASEHNEQLWRTVLETAVDPIVLIDHAGVIVQANAATSVLLGFSHEQMVGKNVSMLMPEPYRTEHDGYLVNYLTSGDAKIIGIGRDVEAQRSDGSIVPIHLAVSEVRGPGGRMFTGIIHDLTARREAERLLQEANEELEGRVQARTAELEALMADLARSNRDLEQFAYIASHDLQAPLRNVRQGLELLDDHLQETAGTSFDDEAQELRQLVVGAASKMEDLIQGLLSYSRVQRHADPINRHVDLNKVVSDALALLQLDLDAANATVEVGDLPAIAGDETQLRQLLQNLIQNAVKYRKPDVSPHISIESTHGDGHWVISVTDNGIGVDPEHHERIFDLFRRGHPGYGGVGLGLAISQRIVERHGGGIWVDSTPNEGASFTFTLPKEAAHDDD